MAETAAPQTGSGNRTWLAYAMLAVVMLLWAGNSLVGRVLRDDVPPLLLAAVRWWGALLLVTPFAWRHLEPDRAAMLRHWKATLLLGVTGVAAFNALLYTGLQYTTAANALLVQALIPAMVLALSVTLFGQRSSLAQVAMVAISTLGVAVIVFRGDLAAVAGFHVGKGEAIVFVACAAWAIYTACLRLAPPIHPASFLFVTFAIGAVAMAAGALAEWHLITARALAPAALAGYAYVAVFPSVVAYVLYNRAVGMIGAAAAGQSIGMMPLFGAVLAWALLGEELHGYHLAGMALILGGLAGAALLRRD